MNEPPQPDTGPTTFPVTCAHCSRSYLIHHPAQEPTVMRWCPVCGARALFWSESARKP